MASLTVFSEAGKEVGTYEIDTETLADRVSKQLLHDAVVMYQANLRQGSHNTRTRGQVAGSKKKMYRQKGTGNARAGGKRTNVRRGGEVVIVDKLAFDSPKTSRMASTLNALGLGGTTTLVAIADQDAAVYKSGRNIAGVSVEPVRQLNALSVLKPKRMLFTKDAMDRIKDGTFAASEDAPKAEAT